MARTNHKIDVQPGPVLRSALDCIDLVKEVLELIPEWHLEQRVELAARATTLAEVYTNLLNRGRFVGPEDTNGKS